MISWLRDLLWGSIRGRASEALWVLGGQVLTFVGGFVALKALTVKLGAERYGEFALGLTIAGLLNLTCYGPLSNVVLRFYSISRERGELKVFLGSLRRYHTILGAALLFGLILLGAFAPLADDGKWYALIAAGCIFGITSGINASISALQNAMRRRRLVAIHQAADIWLRVLMSLGALELLPTYGATAALAAFAGGTTIVVASQLRYVATGDLEQDTNATGPIDVGVRTARSREYLDYALPFMVWSGIAFLSSYGDRWILQFLFGAMEVGVYAAIYQIAAAPLNVLNAAISQWSTPIIYERAGALQSTRRILASMHVFRRILLPATMATGIVVLMLWALGAPVVSLLTSADFAPGRILLLPIAVGVGLFNLAQLLTIQGMTLNKPRAYLLPKVVQNLIFVLIAMVLGQRLGPMGVATGYALSSTVYLLLVIRANSAIMAQFSANGSRE